MSALRDSALILLALEGAIVALLVVGLLGVINYALLRSRWWHFIPQAFARVKEFLYLMDSFVERACRLAVSPIFAVSTRLAKLNVWVRGLMGKE